MFGIFKSIHDRAVTAFITNLLAPLGKVPGAVFRDPYCLGFLQIVGMHVAAKTSKGSTPEVAAAIFEETLKKIAPTHAEEAGLLLSIIRSETSPSNEAYLRGKKDGDTFMGYELYGLASREDSEAALECFSNQVRRIASPPDLPPKPTTKPKHATPSSNSETKAGSPIANTGKWQVAGSGHEFTISRTYSLPDLSSAETTATLKIICTIKSSPEVNWVCSDLRFNFKPLRLPHERPIVLGLFTDEPKGALVEVRALPVPKDNRDALLDVVMLVHSDDVTKLLRALLSGKELTFVLMNATAPDEKPFVKAPPEFLARLSLPNDQEFKKLYDEACEQVAHCQDATRARQLGEGWYRRRSPGRDA